MFLCVHRQGNEKASRLAFAYANDYKSVQEAKAGDIVVISGLKETITGDSLVKGSYKSAENSGKLAGVELPDPVFFCTIESPSMSKQKQLESALENLAREDPSLRVAFSDEVNDQTILKGIKKLKNNIFTDKMSTTKIELPILYLYSFQEWENYI